MKRQTISIQNYKAIMDKVHLRHLPEVLQNGHKFFVVAKRLYHKEPQIKETIDLYLQHLNTYFEKQGEVQHIISEAALNFITRFVAMHKTIQSKTAIETYIWDLHRAIGKKQIVKLSPVAHHIHKIQTKLIDLYNDKLLFKERIKIVINRKWLKELKYIVANSNTTDLSGISEETIQTPSVSSPRVAASDLFSPVNEVSTTHQGDTFRLQGDMGVLLGDIERFELAITIEGDQGGGKTRFTYQLADAFAALGDRVAIFSLEIGSKSDLISRMKQEYLHPSHQNHIFMADRLPNGYQTIAEAAKQFNVVIIDSWNKTGLPSQDFDKLRKQYPETIFIVIFQRTTQKTIRGGTAPLFDAGINIEVVKADDTFKNNYAITTKNRYGVTGIQYNIHAQKIINTAQQNVA